jgi:drug/metabolite transporter (DMT)-like permease
MPVAAALCYAGMVLTTRKLCRGESPVTLAYGVAVAFLIVGSLGVATFSTFEYGPGIRDWPFLFTGWHVVELWVVGLIAAVSLLNVTANLGLAKAYQSAEASWLAPFDYSYLIFATFWGFVFWRHVPDGFTILGMAMIAGAGGFVAWRERRESRLRAAEAEPAER